MFNKSQRNHQNMSAIFELKIEVYKKRKDGKEWKKELNFSLFCCFTIAYARV